MKAGPTVLTCLILGIGGTIYTGNVICLIAGIIGIVLVGGDYIKGGHR